MAHYKRRRRRRGGIKGHCHMCSLRRTDGTRNGRLLTNQEHSHRLKYREGLEEAKQRADVPWTVARCRAV